MAHLQGPLAVEGCSRQAPNEGPTTQALGCVVQGPRAHHAMATGAPMGLRCHRRARVSPTYPCGVPAPIPQPGLLG